MEKDMNKLDLQKRLLTSVRELFPPYICKAGHPGGSLSAADIFTYLYFEELHVDPKNPKDENRDRFVLSKGHTAPVTIQPLLREDFSGRRSSDPASYRFLFTGTPGYEAHSWCGHVIRFSRTGTFCSSRYGTCSEDVR